eukprot:CAMPEP_0181107574 /NCGR_PEP_ID=MMETSP1071-20121207/17161_1 /TAXON_ID=35127 /ORGANISM="Thalassiosira sp., Strain NH16" /LENGTH=175 /DNA_ID=CAMNT_0023191103 /DNA_START=436 /DNA_END=964 /DNA_ORIENTATION=-
MKIFLLSAAAALIFSAAHAQEYNVRGSSSDIDFDKLDTEDVQDMFLSDLSEDFDSEDFDSEDFEEEFDDEEFEFLKSLIVVAGELVAIVTLMRFATSMAGAFARLEGDVGATVRAIVAKGKNVAVDVAGLKRVESVAAGEVIVGPTVVAFKEGARGVNSRRSWRKDWLQNNRNGS